MLKLEKPIIENRLFIFIQLRLSYLEQSNAGIITCTFYE